MADAVLVLTMNALEPACQGRIAGEGQDLGEPDLLQHAAVHAAAGHTAVLVDLDRLAAAAADGVRTLTAFLWSLRVEGLEPVVVCSVYEVVEACRALKLDRAFPLVADRTAALAIFDERQD